MFDKRFETYNELRAIMARAIAHGTVCNDTLIDYLRASDKAQFLFGPEVTAYLNSIYKLLIEHRHASMEEAGLRRVIGAEMSTPRQPAAASASGFLRGTALAQ
jgi:hypothetical protein